MAHPPFPPAIILYPAGAEAADPATADVLDQVKLVEEGLEALGVPHQRVAVQGGRVWEALGTMPGEVVVVNLMEAPPGEGLRHAAATAALELLGVPFTGCEAAGLWLTTDKLATRAVLAAAGLPVAPGGRLWPGDVSLPDGVRWPVIVKPGWEDASVGLEGDPLCRDAVQLAARVRALADRFPGQPLVVEEYLPGREFAVGMLEGAEGVRLLPVAEMAFVDCPPELPRVLSWEAKWLPGSPIDRHTVRRFPSDAEEGPLLAQLRQLGFAAWRTCGVSGYARVDVRLDAGGRPRILEVNANPCLAPDAGFILAAQHGGLDVASVAKALLQVALKRHRRKER